MGRPDLPFSSMTLDEAWYTTPEGSVAQRLAQEAYTFKVPGSNPGAPTFETASLLIDHLHRVFWYNIGIERKRA